MIYKAAAVVVNIALYSVGIMLKNLETNDDHLLTFHKNILSVVKSRSVQEKQMRAILKGATPLLT